MDISMILPFSLAVPSCYILYLILSCFASSLIFAVADRLATLCNLPWQWMFERNQGRESSSFVRCTAMLVQLEDLLQRKNMGRDQGFINRESRVFFLFDFPPKLGRLSKIKMYLSARESNPILQHDRRDTYHYITEDFSTNCQMGTRIWTSNGYKEKELWNWILVWRKLSKRNTFGIFGGWIIDLELHTLVHLIL